MPSINGKKINELLDGSAVEDPLLLIGDQNGKAWNLSDVQLYNKLKVLSLSATNIPHGNIENVITPGVYKIPIADYNDTNYPTAPYFPGMLMSTKLGDVYLIVEKTPGGVILQHMHIPFSNYAIFSRAAYPKHNNSNSRNWFISWGEGIFACEIDASGNPTARSIPDISKVNYAGSWSIYMADLDGNNVTLALLQKFGLPVPVGFTTGYAGYNFLKVEYTSRDYSANNRQAVNFRQTIFYGKLSLDSNSKNPSEFTRILTDAVPYKTGLWMDTTMTGLGGISNNASRPSDNKLKAGTATLPPIVFTPGVQTQSPSVPGAWNYDGTDYYYTDNAGKKHKITSTIIT